MDELDRFRKNIDPESINIAKKLMKTVDFGDLAKSAEKINHLVQKTIKTTENGDDRVILN